MTLITYELKKKLIHNALKINVIAFLAQAELNISYINRSYVYHRDISEVSQVIAIKNNTKLQVSKINKSMINK